MFQTPRLLTAMLLSAASSATAQLTGCTSSTCASSANGVLTCPLGNSTYQSIGTAPVANSPLAWTVGVSASADTASRFFYVSAPSSLKQLGCALFFNGVAERINFPHKADHWEADAGSCPDALGARCVDDLLKDLRGRVGGARTNATLCESLKKLIRDNAPQTCTVAKERKWGEIAVAADLSKAEKVKQDKCYPAGKDKELALVSSYSKSTPGVATDLKEFLSDVTPVLTVLVGGEVELTCLRAVEAKGEGTKEGAAATIRQGLSVAGAMAAVVAGGILV